VDEIREHTFDGIEEYDNPLPRWWLYLFYLTIAFAVVYGVFYPTLWFYSGSTGWSQASQYEAQVAEAAKRWPAATAAGGGDVTALLHDVTALEAGKKIYSTRCAVCHGKQGEGKIGPSFLDQEWKYGADKVVESIQKGRAGGMPPWGKILTVEQVRQVAAFVLSLSQSAAATDPVAEASTR